MYFLTIAIDNLKVSKQKLNIPVQNAIEHIIRITKDITFDYRITFFHSQGNTYCKVDILVYILDQF